jgi:hypothetical protein
VYLVTVQAHEAPRQILTLSNAAAFELKQALNR